MKYLYLLLFLSSLWGCYNYFYSNFSFNTHTKKTIVTTNTWKNIAKHEKENISNFSSISIWTFFIKKPVKHIEEIHIDSEYKITSVIKKYEMLERPQELQPQLDSYEINTDRMLTTNVGYENEFE